MPLRYSGPVGTSLSARERVIQELDRLIGSGFTGDFHVQLSSGSVISFAAESLTNLDVPAYAPRGPQGQRPEFR